jgi:hypothetical protein
VISDSTLDTLAHTRNILTTLGSPFQTGRGSLFAYARPFRFVGQSFKTLFFAFVAIDFTFILLNALAVVAHQLSLIDAVPEVLRITQDGALPEQFNYFKWAVIMISLAWLALRERWLAPFGWALIFAMILADDSLQLHEQFGAAISSSSWVPSNDVFYASNVGEMLAFAVMGLIALAIGTVLYLRSRAAGRALSLRYGLVLLVLGCFGVGVDAAHELVSNVTDGAALATLLSQLFGMVEEGGEMIVASFAVAMTLTTGHLRGRPSVDITEKARVRSS